MIQSEEIGEKQFSYVLLQWGVKINVRLLEIESYFYSGNTDDGLIDEQLIKTTSSTEFEQYQNNLGLICI